MIEVPTPQLTHDERAAVFDPDSPAEERLDLALRWLSHLRAEAFNPPELRLIIELAARGARETFLAAGDEPGTVHLYCVWCHHKIDRHAAHCEGVERTALAGKAAQILTQRQLRDAEERR